MPLQVVSSSFCNDVHEAFQELFREDVMKQVALICMTIALSIGMAFALTMAPDQPFTAMGSPSSGQEISGGLNPPACTFSINPVQIMTSYYDYMLGSYNTLPLRVIPNAQGGGYFLTFHAKASPDGPLKAHGAHLDVMGNLVSNYQICPVTATEEAYPGMAVEPYSGKPVYAMQSNWDADPVREVISSSDAFMCGISGLYNEIDVVIDNSFTPLSSIYNPADNSEFIWPVVQTKGVNSNSNLSRVYVMGRNNTLYDGYPSENVRIAYAYINQDLVEGGIPLRWRYTAIPELEIWRRSRIWRRPFTSMIPDSSNKLYVAGYHFAVDKITNELIHEPDFDVFRCENYGTGAWSRRSHFSNIPSWNPPSSPGGEGYFGSAESSYPDDQLTWRIMNSSNLNAVSNQYGNVIVPALWSLSTPDGNYWPGFHTVKCMIYRPLINTFTISEIYPRKHYGDPFNLAFTPWDTQAPWGEPEYYPNNAGGYELRPEQIFPFPHWDESLHDGNMMFHYNNLKVTEVNEDGMMVAVWQDSYKAKRYHELGDTDYAAYAETPEIYISVSGSSGFYWSDPIILNNVLTPELANIKPMWVYPADTVKYVGGDGYQRLGRLGLLFVDDNDWGAQAIMSPPVTPDNCRVMFAELEIEFPGYMATDDGMSPVAPLSVISNAYPNPFRDQLSISLQLKENVQDYSLKIYNIKGQCVYESQGQAAGTTELTWNGCNQRGNKAPAGVYLLQLKTESGSSVRKVLLD
jgi:hypothetical protein